MYQRSQTSNLCLEKVAIASQDAHVDAQALGFWGDQKQRAYFDVKVFNPYAKTYRNTSLSQCYRRCELQKKRSYEDHICEIEHGTFTPLIFSTHGGMSKETTTMYKHLASLLSEKRSQSYAMTMNWIRCLIGFALIHSTIMRLRGARSSSHQLTNESGAVSPIDLATREGRLYSG